MKIPFTKVVGTGNDFVILDTRGHRLGALARQWPSVARALCDRRNGIGADGVLVLEPSRAADVRMRVFNPDGSEAEMCGNGARCVALYEATPRLRSGQASTRRQATVRDRAVAIETKAGVIRGVVRGRRVAMRMTDPTSVQPELSVSVKGRRIALGFANTGVPHAVVPVRAVDAVDVQQLGRALRRHPRFAPKGTNVNFLETDRARPSRIRIRTYERGVEQETLACGTGVAASAVLHALRRARLNGRPRRARVGVLVRSGDQLDVTLDLIPQGARVRVANVVLAGPAERVFDGVVDYPNGRR